MYHYVTVEVSKGGLLYNSGSYILYDEFHFVKVEIYKCVLLD